MAVSGPKSLAPIEQAIISPINESTTFTPGNTIIFRISSSDMRFWLVQDSYFVFDVDWSFDARPGRSLVIKNSSTFFTNVRIIHGGNEVYYSQYNIAQQFLDYIKTGDDYLAANYNEWTSHSTFNEDVDTRDDYPLIILDTQVPREPDANDRFKITKRGIIMHVSQILKCFSQCENFPLKNCPQAIEIRLQLAQPNEFLCSTTANNFYDIKGNTPAAVGLAQQQNNDYKGAVSEDEIPINSNITYTVKNMRLYMFGAQVQESYASVMSASNESGQGLMWEYTMPRINLRNEPQRESPGYLISNFQCITENVDKIYVWGVRHNNLGVTIRPHVTNMNLRFGAHQLPKSPTSEDNWTKPALYKALVDDVLEYDTAYYTSANHDLYSSYAIIPAEAQTLYQDDTEHDTHLLMAASFTTDDKHPGSPSSAWNSQYNLHYYLVNPEAAMTWVLAVDTQYVLSLRSGMLSSTNI